MWYNYFDLSEDNGDLHSVFVSWTHFTKFVYISSWKNCNLNYVKSSLKTNIKPKWVHVNRRSPNNIILVHNIIMYSIVTTGSAAAYCVNIQYHNDFQCSSPRPRGSCKFVKFFQIKKKIFYLCVIQIIFYYFYFGEQTQGLIRFTDCTISNQSERRKPV